MHSEEMLRDIADRLEKLTIHEVRQVAREVKSHVTSGQKGQIIEAVLSLARAETDPAPLSNRGAPPKSDKYDEKLVADIKACREYYLMHGNDGGNNLKTGVSDSVYEYAVQSEKTYTGILGREGMNHFLFGEEVVFVADIFITRYGLRLGDKVAGPGRKKNSVDLAGLIDVTEVNGQPCNNLKDRKNFSSLTRIYPEKRIYTGENGDIACRMIDLFAPVAMGQRGLVFAPSNSGKTTLLKSIALGICAKYRNLTVINLLLGARPEEVTDFKRLNSHSELFYTTFDMVEERHINCANLAFEYAKRAVELGNNAVIIADGLHENLPAEELKTCLYCACNTEEGSSLTVIAALPEETLSLGKTANSVVKLSSELAEERIFPAIDILKSYTGREECLLTEDELSASHKLRKSLAEGLSVAQLVELFKNTENNSKLVENLKNGR